MHGVRVAAFTFFILGAQGNDCPLLAARPFNIRGVRKGENEWTGDIFFQQWPASYTILLHWKEPTTVLVANHGDIIDASRSTSYFTTIVAQPSGPDDGSARMMLHVQGTHPVTPSIDCFSDQVEEEPSSQSPRPNEPSVPPDEASSAAPPTPVVEALAVSSPTITGGNGQDSYSDDALAAWTEAAAPSPPASQPSETIDTENVLRQQCATSDHAPLELDTSLSMNAVEDESECASMELEIASSLKLCDSSDQLSLLWLAPGDDDEWQTLVEKVSPSQPHIHIDGLDSSSVYKFRLSLRLQGASSRLLGPATPPLLVDGSFIMHLMTGSHLRPVALGTSAVEIGWQRSVCRPQLQLRVWVRCHSRPGSDGMDPLDRAQQAERMLDSAEVEVSAHTVVLQRLRCPWGCQVSLEPTGLVGWQSTATAASPVTTPPLPSVPYGGCRLEVRMKPSADSTLTDRAVEKQLAADVASALGTNTEQLVCSQTRLVEQRLKGRFLIFDLLSADSQSSQQLCDHFSAALFPSQPHRSCEVRATASDRPDACAAAAALAEGTLTSRIDVSGGLVQLLADGTERSLPDWLRLHAPDFETQKPHSLDRSGDPQSPGSSGLLEQDNEGSLSTSGLVLALTIIACIVLLGLMLRRRTTRAKGKSGFARVSTGENTFDGASDDEESAVDPFSLSLSQKLLLVAQRLVLGTRNVESAADEHSAMCSRSEGVETSGPLLTQRVSLETIDGECVKSVCEIYPSDTISSIEARLYDIGERSMPRMRITAISIQFYRPDLKRMMEVNASTTVEELVRTQASEWRVLVLGVPVMALAGEDNMDHSVDDTQISMPAESELYASEKL